MIYCLKILLFCSFGVALLLCSSCCWTCIIANSELSDISTGNYKSLKNVTTITSRNKSVKIAPFNGGQIIAYSYKGQNILASIYDQVNIVSAGGLDKKSKSIEFRKDCFYEVVKPNILLLAETLASSQNDLEFQQNYRMNLNNGDVFITQNLKNNSEKQQSLYLNNKTYFKSGGYVIVPLSIISKMPKKWCYLDKQAKKAKIADAVQIFDDKLIINTAKNRRKIAADPNSGWFAYIWRDLLFVKKFTYGKRGKYVDGIRVTIDSNNQFLVIETPSPEINLKAKENKSLAQKWSIIKLDKPVTSTKEAIESFQSLPIQLILNR